MNDKPTIRSITLEHTNHLLMIALISVTVLLVMVGALAGYVSYLYLNAPPPQEINYTAVPENKAVEEPVKEESSIKEVEKVEEREDNTEPEKIVIHINETPVVLSDITWLDELEEVEYIPVFKEQFSPYGHSVYTAPSRKMYLAGTVNEGVYEDYQILISDLDIGINSMGGYRGWYRFIKHNEEMLLLEAHSDVIEAHEYSVQNKYDELNPEEFSIATNIQIEHFDYPEEIIGPHGEKLQRDTLGFWGGEQLFDNTGLVEAFTHTTLGTLYTDTIPPHEDAYGDHGFYARAPDGFLLRYSLVIDFIGEGRVPRITWNDGTENTTGYIYTDVGGCGSYTFASVTDPAAINVQTDLVAIGQTDTGDAVYGLKIEQHPLLRNYYDTEYYVFDGGKDAYSTFLANRPIIFWVDSFERLIKLQSLEYIPPVECGKPVIYLYPEEPIDVFVEIELEGGFSKTEPAYGDGWQVHAYPDGTLVEIQTGKTYPYLFWEGRGGMYEIPSKGFVVEEKDVHSFLVEKLTLLGLNESEQTDFLDYWEPYMQNDSAPYYFITFVPQKAIDALAPLTVTPEPDTIIRVLMDYRPLEAPIEVEWFTIRTPKRNGFTVVEWGGVRN